MYYNFAAGSFLSKKLCSTLHSIEVDFYSKNRQICDFEPPFRGVRDNPRPLLMARWKARRRLPIRHNWTFFASSYRWDVTGGNLSMWAIFKGGWVTSIAHFGWKVTSLTNTTTVVWQKTRRIALSCGIKNIAGRFFGLVTKHACDGRTDGRTDRITTPKTALA